MIHRGKKHHFSFDEKGAQKQGNPFDLKSQDNPGMAPEIPVPMNVSRLRGHIPPPHPSAPEGGMLLPLSFLNRFTTRASEVPNAETEVWLPVRQGRLAHGQGDPRTGLENAPSTAGSIPTLLSGGVHTI